MKEFLDGFSAAAETLKRMRTLSKTVENAEMMTLLAELQNDLADLKLEAVNLKGELARLTEENQRLRERIDKKETGKPILKDGAYAFEGEDGHFCTACFDSKQQKIRVSPLDAAFSFAGRWSCPVCKATMG